MVAAVVIVAVECGKPVLVRIWIVRVDELTALGSSA